MDRPVLTLADLEANDLYAPAGKAERRFCCPACGNDKPRDAEHRSLSVQVETGAWHCHRCAAGGVLREHWRQQPLPRRDRDRADLARAFRVPPPTVRTVADDTTGPPWRPIWERAQPVPGTPGERYLIGRGIPVAIAEAAGVRYTRDCFGRPAVLFPIGDRAGNVVAFNARHTDGRADPKAHSGGPKSAGVFATPGALAATPLVVTEAPLDALSLAVCGVPAVALAGKTGPVWLPSAAMFRPVAVALDADAEGDRAAEVLRTLFESRGAAVTRLRPIGGKDWNEILPSADLPSQLATLRRTPSPATPAPAGGASDLAAPTPTVAPGAAAPAPRLEVGDLVYVRWFDDSLWFPEPHAVTWTGANELGNPAVKVAGDERTIWPAFLCSLADAAEIGDVPR